MILVAKMAFWLETPEPYNPSTSSFLSIYHHHHQRIKLQTNPSPFILSASLVVHNWIWFESQLLWDLKSIWISECRGNSIRVVHMEKGTSFILISKLHVRDKWETLFANNHGLSGMTILRELDTISYTMNLASSHQLQGVGYEGRKWKILEVEAEEGVPFKIDEAKMLKKRGLVWSKCIHTLPILTFPHWEKLQVITWRHWRSQSWPIKKK